MKIFSHFKFTDIEDFEIEIGEIIAGWMDITIGTNNENFKYSASYIGDPLNELLYATDLLLINKPHIIRCEFFIKDTAIVTHHLEPETINWLINYNDNILTILIWKNINTDLLEDLGSCNFDKDLYKKQYGEEYTDSVDYYDYGETNLEKTLLFALKGEPTKFVKTLVDICKNLDILYEDEKYKNCWGFSYDTDCFNSLVNWLNNKNNN